MVEGEDNKNTHREAQMNRPTSAEVAAEMQRIQRELLSEHNLFHAPVRLSNGEVHIQSFPEERDANQALWLFAFRGLRSKAAA
jgi:hypothetical protein